MTRDSKVIRWKQALRPDKLTPEPYGLISTCENYRIAKAIMPDRTVYSLFEGKTLLGRYPTADEAKKAAQNASIRGLQIANEKKKPED